MFVQSHEYLLTKNHYIKPEKVLSVLSSVNIIQIAPYSKLGHRTHPILQESERNQQ